MKCTCSCWTNLKMGFIHWHESHTHKNDKHILVCSSLKRKPWRVMSSARLNIYSSSTLTRRSLVCSKAYFQVSINTFWSSISFDFLSTWCISFVKALFQKYHTQSTKPFYLVDKARSPLWKASGNTRADQWGKNKYNTIDGYYSSLHEIVYLPQWQRRNFLPLLLS